MRNKVHHLFTEYFNPILGAVILAVLINMLGILINTLRGGADEKLYSFFAPMIIMGLFFYFCNKFLKQKNKFKIMKALAILRCCFLPIICFIILKQFTLGIEITWESILRTFTQEVLVVITCYHTIRYLEHNKNSVIANEELPPPIPSLTK